MGLENVLEEERGMAMGSTGFGLQFGRRRGALRWAVDNPILIGGAKQYMIMNRD